MKTLYFDFAGENFIPLIKSLTSSTPVWLAASISTKSKELPAVISRQEEHLLQGSEFLVRPLADSQFMALANILAIDVLPDPRGPDNK